MVKSNPVKLETRCTVIPLYGEFSLSKAMFQVATFTGGNADVIVRER